MKTLNYLTLSFTLLFGIIAKAQAPDQNPNYKESQTKYTEQAETLNATQGVTIQDTYEAFDWTEYKVQKKQDRKDRRLDRYKMRYQYNHNHYNNNGGYYNNGYNNNYNNNGYNNNYNSGYYNNGPSCNSSSNLYNSILLGAGLYYLFN